MLILVYILTSPKQDISDIYEDIYADMVYASKSDENSDLSMTYLGQTEMTRSTEIKAEERLPITGQGFASGKLLDGMRMSNFIRHRCYKVIHVKVILYWDAKLYMHYPNSLQTCKESKWKNRQYVSVLFVIPVIIDIHGHRFDIFTLVSKIHDHVDLVMGMKNIFEPEGM